VVVLLLLVMAVQSENSDSGSIRATNTLATANYSDVKVSESIIRAPNRPLALCGAGKRLHRGKCREVW
jgi:hypothetical protein